MLLQTEGIVLKSTKFSESSLVVRIFTESAGCLSFMLKGVRSSAKRSKSSLYIAGNVLDMEIRLKENSTWPQMREARQLELHHHIQGDMLRTSLLFFCLEVMNKCLREDHEQRDVFNFLKEQLQRLDRDQPADLILFPQRFLLGLSVGLGFQPAIEERFFSYFDLHQGVFVDERPLSEHLEGAECRLLQQLLLSERTEADRNCRKRLLDGLIRYFSYHVQGFGRLQSPDILEDLLSA